MAYKVTIISQDYDGCYCIMTPEGVHDEMNGLNKEFWEESGLNVLDRIKYVQTKYNEFLTKITKDAKEVRVYVGSDRQSYRLDNLNISHNHNGSVFPAICDLCHQRNSPKQAWTHETMLMADPAIPGKKPYLRARGEAYQRIRMKYGRQLDVMDSPLMFVNSDGKKVASKRPMLLNQMWDAYRQNPKATELDFHFIDDRIDIINDILQHLDPKDLPPNMTLTVSRFNYGMVMVSDDPKALCDCGEIVSQNVKLSPFKKLTSIFHSKSPKQVYSNKNEGENKIPDCIFGVSSDNSFLP